SSWPVSFAAVAEEKARGIALQLIGYSRQLEDERARVGEELLRLGEAALSELAERGAVLLDDGVEMRGQLGEVLRRLVQFLERARRAIGDAIAGIEALAKILQQRCCLGR